MSRERQILQMALLAGLAGAGLGLLLAPKPGQELRHDLEGWLDRTRERLNPAEIERTVTHFVRNTLDQTEGIVKGGQSVIENKLHALLAALEAGKQAYEDEQRRFAAEDKSLNGSDRVSRAG
ncbi:MAG: hypothetical protein ABIO65_05990 [Nitrospiria bacterium]